MAPDGPGDVTVRIPARACGEAHAVCIGGRALAEAVEAAVPGPPLTASFTQAPAAHDGSNRFLLHLEFSHEPKEVQLPHGARRAVSTSRAGASRRRAGS